MTTVTESLLSHYQLISSQVNKAQVATILNELERVLDHGIGGAIVEFGCYIGTTSLFVRRLLDVRGDSREFHVYDSFAGLPAKSDQDASRAGEQFMAGELAVSKKQFVREFQKAGLRPPTIHKGWFKDLDSGEVPASIAFAFLDGDFYASIRDSLRLVLPGMAAGGVIIVDDYAREALPGVAKAVSEQIHSSNVRTVYNLGVLNMKNIS